MLAAEVPLSTTFDIAKTFGGDFTAALLKVETGRWTGPVESGFGTHLVFVSERVEGRALPLSEIREGVERDFLAQRRKERLEALYQGLLKKYRVEVARPEEGPGRAAAAQASPAAVPR
jgi:parvulin-like peptidyl-prolyl isomerase